MKPVHGPLTYLNKPQIRKLDQLNIIKYNLSSLFHFEIVQELV